MLRWLPLASLAAILALSSPVSAQTEKKGDEKTQKDDKKKKDKKKKGDKETAEGQEPEPKPEPKKEESDVVFDNREWTKKHEEERRKEQEADGSFTSDTPFADTAPDPVALREQRWKPGFGGGYRLGWAFPMGDLYKLPAGKSLEMSDALDGMIFIWGDVGYWPIPQLFVGLYLSGGYLLPDCQDGASCSGWDVRGGPEILWRILPFQDTTPFVGIAGGYEWMMLKGSTSQSESTNRFHGWELANFQAGVEVRTRGTFYGIFVAYSLGQFSKYSSDRSFAGKESSESGDIEDKGTHSWLAIGARGTLE